MGRLSGVVVEKLLRHLDNTPFTRHSFGVAQGESDADPSLRISLLDYPEYYFAVSYGGSFWRLSYCPGEMLLDAGEQDSNLEGVELALVNWTLRLTVELALRAARADPVDAFRKELAAAADAFPEPDRPFTRAEADDWTRKLDAALAQFERDRDKMDITADEIIRLKTQIDKLTEIVTKVPRRVWVRSAGNTVADFFERISTKALAAITEGAVRALLPPR